MVDNLLPDHVGLPHVVGCGDMKHVILVLALRDWTWGFSRTGGLGLGLDNHFKKRRNAYKKFILKA